MYQLILQNVLERVKNFGRPPRHGVVRAELCGVSHLQGAANNLLLPANLPYSHVNCEVCCRAELDMWSHVVRRHMCLSSTPSPKPSQAVAHFFHLCRSCCHCQYPGSEHSVLHQTKTLKNLFHPNLSFYSFWVE